MVCPRPGPARQRHPAGHRDIRGATALTLDTKLTRVIPPCHRGAIGHRLRPMNRPFTKIRIELENEDPKNQNEWMMRILIDDKPVLQKVLPGPPEHLPPKIGPELLNVLAKLASP